MVSQNPTPTFRKWAALSVCGVKQSGVYTLCLHTYSWHETRCHYIQKYRWTWRKLNWMKDLTTSTTVTAPASLQSLKRGLRVRSSNGGLGCSIRVCFLCLFHFSSQHEKRDPVFDWWFSWINVWETACRWVESIMLALQNAKQKPVIYKIWFVFFTRVTHTPK